MGRIIDVRFGGDTGAVTDKTTGLMVRTRVMGALRLTCDNEPAQGEEALSQVAKGLALETLAKELVPMAAANVRALFGDPALLSRALAKRLNQTANEQGIQVEVTQLEVLVPDEDRINVEDAYAALERGGAAGEGGAPAGAADVVKAGPEQPTPPSVSAVKPALPPPPLGEPPDAAPQPPDVAPQHPDVASQHPDVASQHPHRVPQVPPTAATQQMRVLDVENMHPQAPPSQPPPQQPMSQPPPQQPMAQPPPSQPMAQPQQPSSGAPVPHTSWWETEQPAAPVSYGSIAAGPSLLGMQTWGQRPAAPPAAQSPSGAPAAGKCPQCGEALKPNSRFCSSCGTKLA